MMNTFLKNWVTAHLFLCAFATEFTWIIISLFYLHNRKRGWINSQQFQEWYVQKDFQDCDTTGFGNSTSLLSKTCFLIWFITFHVLCIYYNLCSNNVVQTWSWAILTDNEGFRGLLDFWSSKLAALTNRPMTSPLNSFRTLGWMPSCPRDLSTSSLSTRSRKFYASITIWSSTSASKDDLWVIFNVINFFEKIKANNLLGLLAPLHISKGVFSSSVKVLQQVIGWPFTPVTLKDPLIFNVWSLQNVP